MTFYITNLTFKFSYYLQCLWLRKYPGKIKNKEKCLNFQLAKIYVTKYINILIFKYMYSNFFEFQFVIFFIVNKKSIT